MYETDPRGFCTKNGPHCAFAHGPHDIRPPIYDVREMTGGGLEDEDHLVSPLVGSLEKERGVLVDDPRWQGELPPSLLRLVHNMKLDGHYIDIGIESKSVPT